MQSITSYVAGQDSSTYGGGSPHSVVDETKHNGCNNNVYIVVPQSEAFAVTTGTKATTSQNVEFMDNNPAFNYIVSGTDDPTRGIADMGDATLGEFLSRPILIEEYTWTPGLAFFEQFNPWEKFMNNSRNINRVANFNLYRSRLCVRFLINGNGFYYGRMLASYNPLPNHDQTSVWADRALGSGPLDADAINASQKPHIYLNPTECQGGDLCLPFVHYQNALKVPESQWSEMGDVTLLPLTALKNANGAVDPITISVFAYLEDVNLSIPTNKNPVTVIPQSDEYGDTPISGPASVVARVSGALTNTPFIGRFARATQMAANAVGGIAKLFGMSRPATIEPIQTYKPEYVGGLANTNTPDGTNRLSLDVKQEVTIDPGVVGIGSEDEMGLVSLASRESYYTSFKWDPVGGGASGPGYRLFHSQVHPFLNQVVNPGSIGTLPQDIEEFHMLPMGLAAFPFEAWGGSMEFRFQIVCSNFHRGRIRVVWDPVDVDGFGNFGYNTAYNRVVDITDKKDFTFKVGWGKEYSFLPTPDPFFRYVDGTQTKPIPTFASTNKPYTFTSPTGNGTLSVYIVNDLTVPNTNPGVDNSIEVNVFARMCDDARFAQPMDLGVDGNRPMSYFRPGNFSPGLLVEPQAEAMQEQEMAPVSQNVDTVVAPEQPTTDHMMSVFYGEQITSIRQLLKRYCLHSCTPCSGDFHKEFWQPDMPFYGGYCPNGKYVVDSGNYAGAHFSYANTTFLNLFTPAFVGYRGGLRWKHQMVSYDRGVTSDVFTASRISGIESSLSPSTGATNALYNPGYEKLRANQFGYGGGQQPYMAQRVVAAYSSLTNGGFTTPSDLNPVCEIDLPFYNNRRFMEARRINNLAPRTLDDELPPVHRLDVGGICAGIVNYVASAEDFSLAFFVGVPPMFNVGVYGQAFYPIPDPVVT